jgi:hypothetical protein
MRLEDRSGNAIADRLGYGARNLKCPVTKYRKIPLRHKFRPFRHKPPEN